MTDKEKVEKALERINKEGLENKRIAPNDLLKAIASAGIKEKEIAYEMSQIINLTCDLREILEDE